MAQPDPWGVASDQTAAAAPDPWGVAPANSNAQPAPQDQNAKLDALLAKYGNNPDAAIQNAPDDATATAVANRYEQNKKLGPAFSSPDPWAVAPEPQTGGQKVTNAPTTSWSDLWDRVWKPNVMFAKAMWGGFEQQALGLGEAAFNAAAPQIAHGDKAATEELKAPVNDWFAQTRSDVAGDIKANTPNLDPKSWQNYTYQTAAGITQMAPVLMATALTENPAVGAVMMGGQAGGDKYAEALNNGRNHDQAAMDAGFSAITNTAIGSLPLHVLMKPGGTFLAKTLQNAGAFGLQSVATEALQIGYDWNIINPNMTWAQAWPRLEQAGVVGTLTGAFFGAGHHGLEMAASRLHAQGPTRQPSANAPASPSPSAPEGEPGAPPSPAAAIGLERPGRPPAVPVEPGADKTGWQSPANFGPEHDLMMAQLTREAQAAADKTVPPARRGNIPEDFAAALRANGAPVEQLGGGDRVIRPEGTAPEAPSMAKSEVWGTPPAGYEAPTPDAEALNREFPKVITKAAVAHPDGEGIPRRDMDSDIAITSSGRQVPVRYAVVEANHLVPSQTPDGIPNPQFPAELQPRDRTRAISQNQIAQIAQNLNPRLLDKSVSAADGAPIISSSGIVESGNGRSLALQRAYAQGMPSADAYRAHLQAQGYPVENMKAPVLVRVREGEMSPDERQAFVREANQSAQLGYSATERAMTDAAATPEHVMDLYRGGDVELAQNRDFVRAFMRHAVPENEHAGMIDAHGGLSQEAVRRVRAAMLAKAYGDPDLVSAIVENQDNDIKAIGGALTDAAPEWSKMRGMAADGRIPANMDQTKPLLDAVKLVAHARSEGRNVAEYVAQKDMFSGEAIAPDVEGWLATMFKNTQNWTKPRGRDKIADALRYYSQEAQKVQPGPNLFGGEPVSPGDLRAQAQARQDGGPAPANAQIRLGEDTGAFGQPGNGSGGQGGLFAPRPGTPQAGHARADRNSLGPLASGFKFGPKHAAGDHQDIHDELVRYILDSGVDFSKPEEVWGALANYVMQRGQERDTESFAFVDHSKGIGAHTSTGAITTNKPRSVDFNEGTRGTLADRAGRIVTFHNHPSSVPFSTGDIESLALPGHAVMVVAGHNGTWYAMARDYKIPAIGGRAAGLALHLGTEAADSYIERALRRSIRANFISTADAWQAHYHILATALDQAGIVRYHTSYKPTPAIEKLTRDIAPGAAEVAGRQFDSAAYAPTRWSASGVRVYGRPESLRLGEGVARLLGGDSGNAGQLPGAQRNPADTGAPGAGYRKPVQLKLLEDADRYAETPEFKAWFGNSKVTGADGKPLVVYHGTPANREITKFNTPAYFTEDPSFAYAFTHTTRATIYPVYLKIEHPYEIDGAVEGRHFEWDKYQVRSMKRQGYDGVIVRGGEDESDIYTPFDQNQIKSATGNRGTFDPREASIIREEENRYEETRPPFYSALGRGIAESKMSRAPAKDWIGFIENLKNKGVKDEEIQWSGIKDWLQGRTGPVTKADVQQALAENEVRLTDVTRGGIESRDDMVPDEIATKEFGPRWEEIVAKIQALEPQERTGTPEGRWEAVQVNNRLRASLDELHDQMIDDSFERAKAAGKVGGRTLFHIGQGAPLPGGRDYREVVLTLGGRISREKLDAAEKMQDQARAARTAAERVYDRTFKADPYGEETAKALAVLHTARQAYIDAERARLGARDKYQPFTQGHFPDRNNLVHFRYDTRIGPNGEKVMHVAEIQSDIHERARKLRLAEIMRLAAEAGVTDKEQAMKEFGPKVPADFGYNITRYALRNKKSGNTSITFATQSDVKAYMDQLPENMKPSLEIVEDRSHPDHLPDFPFKNSWHELAMKRILRHAAEHGYDKVSWDTGETNANRYGLSKRVQHMNVQKDQNGNYEVDIIDSDGNDVTLPKEAYSAQELPDVVGKEMADKIVDDIKGNGERKSYSGLDFRVGGEGMRGFYDRILPQFVSRYVKKFGAKVGKSQIEVEPSGFVRQKFEGPVLGIVDVRDRMSGNSWQRETASVQRQVRDLYYDLEDGVPFQEAADRNLSVRSAEYLGGKMVDRPTPPVGIPVHSVDITPAMRESVMGGQPLFEEKNRYAEPEGEHLLQHNMSAANIIHADRMGGIAAPSLAVVKKAHPMVRAFGEVTMIGSREMANPRSGTKVFGADIYSPRYPQITYRLDDRAIKRIDDVLKPYRKSDEGRVYYDRKITDPRNLRSIPGFEAYAQDTTGEKYPDYQQVGEYLLQQSGATQHIWRGTDNRGRTRYAPHTLENVVRQLKKNIRGGENFNYGVGYLRSHYAPEFKSVKAIKEAGHRLLPTEKFEAVKKEVDDGFWELANSLGSYYQHGSDRFGYGDTVINVLADAKRQGLPRALAEYGFKDVPEERLVEARDFLNKLTSLPTEYFEAKILRGVGLSEFPVAVIPDNLDRKARGILEKRGVDTIEYKHGDEADRTRAINEAARKHNALFEDKNRYADKDMFSTEPGAVDAQGNALPQTIIPGAEASAVQLAKARENAGKGLKTSKATQKEAGPLFGPGEGAAGGKQGSLFEDENRYTLHETPPVASSRPLQNLKDTVRKGAEDVFDLVHDVQNLVAPMATGTSKSRAAAKTFANMMRLAHWHGQRMDDLLKRGFNPGQRRKMWEAADEQSVAMQKGEPTAGIGLSRLTPEERQAVQEQQADAQNVWNAAKDMGMVSGNGLPSYVPRMMVEIADTGVRRLGEGEAARSVPGIGRNLRTRTGQMLRRKYLHTAETESAASSKFETQANVVRDIRTLPLATARLREAVAGRALINEIKAIGAKTGEDTVVEGTDPSRGTDRWFHLNHPSFFTWRPKFVRDAESGEYVVQKDQAGNTVLEKTPLWVRGDFEGPLKAVLSQDTGKVYNALMALKGKAMTTIMYSPLIHNAVEWGRALPAMPGKVATFKIYFEGNRAKRDPEQMAEAITHGLAPIGHRGGYQDITSIATGDQIKAGRSWTAKILGFIPGLFDPRAGVAVYRTIDAMGDLWHNTFLWDRVGDLQMGIYTNMRDQLVRKNFPRDAAASVAAHFANRYAGALPIEAMSGMARKIANIVMFSRTFTLGNLGAMKDMITGLPRDVQAQIEETHGPEVLSKIKSVARRKAIAIVATDIALMYAGNSILQSAIAYITGQQDLSDIEKGYATRLNAELHRIGENPLELLDPFSVMGNLSATSQNEPGREDRILVGYDRDGTAIYARNPTGKIGEEFKNWLTSPLDTLKSKFGTVMRPTYEVLTNDAGFGRRVYDPNAKGFSGILHNIGRVIDIYLANQVPLDSLKSGFSELLAGATNRGANAPPWLLRGAHSLGLTEKPTAIDAYKTVGPLAGVTFRKGAGGGPAVGATYALQREQQARQAEAMPGIVQKIKSGDVQGARADMKALGMQNGLINWYVRTTLNPTLKLNSKRMRGVLRSATPEERARINGFKEMHP